MPEQRSVNCPLPRDARTWIIFIFFILLGGMLLLFGLYFFIRTLIWAIGIVIIALVVVFMCIFMLCPKCLTACTCGGGEAEKEHSYEGSCRYAKDPEAARSRKRRRQRRRNSSDSSSDDSEYERERRRRKRRRKERRERRNSSSDDSYDDIRYEDEKRRRKGNEKDDNAANEKRKKWVPACVARRKGSDSDSGLDVP